MLSALPKVYGVRGECHVTNTFTVTSGLFGQISGRWQPSKQTRKISRHAEIITLMQKAEIRIREHFPHGLSPQPALLPELVVFLWLDQVEPCENHTVVQPRTPLTLLVLQGPRQASPLPGRVACATAHTRWVLPLRPQSASQLLALRFSLLPLCRRRFDKGSESLSPCILHWLSPKRCWADHFNCIIESPKKSNSVYLLTCFAVK